MYGIFTYISHKKQPNVGEYTSPMIFRFRDSFLLDRPQAGFQWFKGVYVGFRSVDRLQKCWKNTR